MKFELVVHYVKEFEKCQTSDEVEQIVKRLLRLRGVGRRTVLDLAALAGWQPGWVKKPNQPET